jgi:hypothetical protein
MRACGGALVSAERAYSRSWSVGRRTVTLAMRKPEPGQLHSIAMQWEPDLPRSLTKAELKQYRTGRNQALRELSAELGMAGPIVVEVG